MPDLFQTFFTFFRGVVGNHSEGENICESDDESAHIIGKTAPMQPNDNGEGEDDDGDDDLFHNACYFVLHYLYCKSRAKPAARLTQVVRDF